MRVLIVGCGLAGMATALGLATRSRDERNDDDDCTSSSMEIILIERRETFISRGATFGLARNGQASLKEIAPPMVLETLKNLGIHMQSSGGYMLPWWKVRDTLLETIQGTSPYTEMIKIYLGCVVEKVENIDQEDKPVRVSFASSSSSSSTATLPENVPETQEFDVVIGADGVHSQIRTEILGVPPPVPSDTVVWRGSVDTNVVKELQHCQEYPPGKFFGFGPDIVLAYFNFHTRLPGMLAWVFSCQNAAKRKIVPGTTTPLDIFTEYRASLLPEKEAEEAASLDDAIILMENTNHPSDLTWSTELAVVDLDAFSENRWGGKGRVTIIGDAAHSIRPASGLGGSLAFEDAALLTRALLLDSSAAATIPERLANFEARRLPRCRSISTDQTLRSKLAYKVGPNVPPWDPAYAEWVLEGPDASPYPPVDEKQVFAALLSELETNSKEQSKE